MLMLRKKISNFFFLILFSILLISCSNPGTVKKIITLEKESTETGILQAGYYSNWLSVNDITNVILSIEDSEGNIIYDSYNLVMYNLNGSFISQELQLTVGTYNLTSFLLIDSEENVLYAAPIQGSQQALNVSNPLSIPFTIEKDQATSVIPQVINTANLTPSDFGYSTFTFDVVEPDDKAAWTIMIHLAVDNNLEYAYEETYKILETQFNVLENIAAGDLDNKINILILLDASRLNINGYMSPYKDGYYHLTGLSIQEDLVIEIEEINSGSVTDVNNFIDWAISNYPAEKYFYSIFNHGGGFDDPTITGVYQSTATEVIQKGIGYDDSNDMDRLTHHELELITGHLKSLTGQSIDLMFLDACLMGGVELVYQLRNNVDYIIFSEELYPISIWMYDDLDILNINPDITGHDLGINILDGGYEYFTTGVIPDGLVNSFILSLADTSQADAFYQAIDEYALEALNDITVNENALVYNDAAQNSESMYFNSDNSYYYKDIDSYLKNILNSPYISQSVKDKAAVVRTALNDIIIHKVDTWYRDFCGLSIFHNVWGSQYYNYPIDTYRSILTFSTNSWTDYQQKLVDEYGILTNTIIEPDIYEPDDDILVNENIMFPNDPEQIHTIHEDHDYDPIKLDLTNITPGTEILIETSPYSIIVPGAYLTFIIQCTQYGVFADEINSDRENPDNDHFPDYSFICETPGIYYLHIRSYNQGDYKIKVTTIE